MKKKTSRFRRWFNVLVPATVLIVGVLILGRQERRSSADEDLETPSETARVPYQLPAKQQGSSGENWTTTVNQWQSTAITGGCKKVN